MDGPYRSAPVEQDAAVPRDAGIVGDVIGQFADPLAFYRELVQNAIDAGTPEVAVRIGYDESEQAVRVAVRDHGEGMDQDVVENQLLVLFRSTKEQDATKIGKFGIGFASVFAPGPRVVVVDTSRGGRHLTLHLYPGLDYQLFDLGPARSTGTTVELVLPMAADGVAAFAARSREALRRWCRHASCPIQLTAPGLDERIDGPLGIDGALVEVRATEGPLTAVVALLPDASPYGGFFNHGLMLYETREDLIGRLAFKVQDARLGHTLSRDNVRRDDAYDRALAVVRGLARELPAAAARALSATVDDGAAYRALVQAIALAGIELASHQWVVPLLDGRGGVVLAELHRVLGASSSSPLTRALAAAGATLVDTGKLALAEVCGRTVTNVAAEYTLVSPIAAEPADELLLAELRDALDHAHRAPASIVLAELDGCDELALALAGNPDDDPWILHREQARRSPFARMRRSALVLGATHPQVAAARRLAVTEPRLAAVLLARAILLQHRLLDVEVSERLLARGPR